MEDGTKEVLYAVGAGLVAIGGSIVTAIKWLAKRLEVQETKLDKEREEHDKTKQRVGRLEGAAGAYIAVNTNLEKIQENITSLSSTVLQAVTDQENGSSEEE